MIWCVLDSDERQHVNHNVERGAAACPHTHSNCNHNVKLALTHSWFLDNNKIITWSMVQQRVHLRITIAIIQWFSYRNKIHNVEYALEAVVDLYAKWMRVRFVCMPGPKFPDSLCEEVF